MVIVEALTRNTSLKALYMSTSTRGKIALADGLAVNSALEELDLGEVITAIAKAQWGNVDSALTPPHGQQGSHRT